MKADPQRRETEFGRWVDDVGVGAVVAALEHDEWLRITTGTVYGWLSGRTQPTPQRAVALVEFSRGRLTLGMIYEHTQTMRRKQE